MNRRAFIRGLASVALLGPLARAGGARVVEVFQTTWRLTYTVRMANGNEFEVDPYDGQIIVVEVDRDTFIASGVKKTWRQPRPRHGPG